VVGGTALLQRLKPAAALDTEKQMLFSFGCSLLIQFAIHEKDEVVRV